MWNLNPFPVIVLALLLLSGVSRAEEVNNNGLDENVGIAPPSDAQLIDQVLYSDVAFGPDEDDAPSPQLDSSDEVENEVEQLPIRTEKPFCTGCPEKVDPAAEKIKDMASFAFQEHLSKFDEMELAQRMVKVVSAMRQVVAGLKYIMEIEVGVTNCTKAEHDKDLEGKCQIDPKVETFVCNFEVVERAWLNEKEVVRSDCTRQLGNAPSIVSEDYEISDINEDDDKKKRKKRKKRGAEADKFGGSRDAEESPEQLMDLAKFGVEQLDIVDADDEARMVMEVLESKKKTVSGWLYDLKLRVAFTTCKESEEITMEKCKDKIVQPYRICKVKILFQPWQEVQRKVTESQCYPEKAFYKEKKEKKKAKQLEFYSEKDENEVEKSPKSVGGFRDIDVESKDLQELVEFVVDSVDQQSNAMHAQKLVKIVEAQRQVVAGLKTRMVVELGYTSCRKHSKLDKSQCEVDESRDHQFCNVTVLEQPWMKSRQITNTKCGPKETMFQKEDRTKRSLSMFNLGSMLEGQFTEHEHKDFKDFVEKYEKQYESAEEYKYRLGIFKENMKKVKVLQDNEQGTATYGATMFADLTEEEFTKRHLGLRPDLKQSREKKIKKAKIPYVRSLPDSFDWRDYNAVTPVKNQGLCGSCWAFSVTGNIEGGYAKKYNKLLSLSEQELVDCDTLDEGCNGGLPENAYKALEKLGGLETETNYPYDGKGDKCSFDRTKAIVKVKDFVELPKNETEMAAWLVKNGPISIGINANAMQFYMGGVSHPWKFLCSSKQLDHGVLIVGYGVHTTSIRHKVMPYWIVKNSWGTSWGEKGYYRIFRGDGSCGVDQMASSAIVA